MNLQHLAYFQALAHYQHMAFTAEKLDITQPTLSYAIRKLEDELGVPLFEKEGRNIKLSIYGTTFLKYVEKGLDALKEGKAKLKDLSTGNTGRIVLGSSSIIAEDMIAKMLAGFRSKNENAAINFTVKRAATEHLLTDLASEKIDLALVSLTDAAKTQHKWQSLQINPLVSQRLIAIMPSDLALASKHKVTLNDLAPYNMLTFTHQSSIRTRLDRLWQRKSIQPNIRLETDSLPVLTALVANKQGVALIPAGVYQQFSNPRIVALPIADDVQYRIYLITKSPVLLSRIANRFKHYVQAYFLQHADEFRQ